MKLLVINTVPFAFNGISSVIMNYYRNMDKTDLQTDFAVSQINEEFRTELEQSGARIFLLPRNRNPLGYMKNLYMLLRKERYDIVHIHGNSATMLVDLLPGVLAGVPVRIAHGHSTSCSHQKAHKLMSPFFKLCYTQGFACSWQAGKFLYANRPFLVVENGVALDRYRFDPSVRSQFRQLLGAGDKRVIGHIGYFQEVKNHRFLLDAFAALLEREPGCLLALIGEGELMEAVRQQAVDLGIAENVVFVGKTNQVPGYLQAMDLLVLPSLYEGLPVVLVEAQAAGLPCLVSGNVSRASDLSEEVTFLPITDPEIWADAIRQLPPADREANCEKWHPAIREAGFDITRNARRMRQLYAELLREKGR